MQMERHKLTAVLKPALKHPVRGYSTEVPWIQAGTGFDASMRICLENATYVCPDTTGRFGATTWIIIAR
ncbi:uncharacterized [Tachysurus ichikawai]